MPNTQVFDGPKGLLNNSGDGPHAFSCDRELAQYNTARWLFDYAADNVEINDAEWSCHGGAEGLISIYTVHCQDTETGETWERYLEIEEVGETGVRILDAVCSGHITPEQAEDEFRDWAEKIHSEGL